MQNAAIDLAKPEQEPIIDRRLKVKIGRQYGYDLNGHWFYLQPADEYANQALTNHSGITAPPKPKWVNLTDEQIEKIVDQHTTDDGGYDIFCDGRGVAREVMAKLQDLNK
jgi:hypothetical protein